MQTIVATIKQGDEFHHEGRLIWTALEDARLEEKARPDLSDYGPWEVRLNVQHADGGTNERVWDDQNLVLEVTRDAS